MPKIASALSLLLVATIAPFATADDSSSKPIRALIITGGCCHDYEMPMDELYVIEHVWPNTQVLARSTSEKTGETHPVIWTSKYGKARVFGTTYGHSNETFSDAVFLTTLTRGIQWAAGTLGE